MTGDVADVRDFGAIGDGVADDTHAFNRAIESIEGGGELLVPRGLYLIDPGQGIVLTNGLTIRGQGDSASVLVAAPGPGSIIRRDFDVSSTNSYLQDVCIQAIGIVLSHPSRAGAANYEQIGFDLRNVTRSTVVECYVGNYPRGSLEKPRPEMVDAIQGYGVVLGTRAGPDPSYAGGEVNSIVRTTVWGVRKAIIADDRDLCPLSAAHAVVVDNCDVQICEVGIGTESQHTAGCSFRDNIVQAVQRARGSQRSTACYVLAGYNNEIAGGYIEALDADANVLLTESSRANRVWLSTQTKRPIVDRGRGNRVRYLDSETYKDWTSQDGRRILEAYARFDGGGELLGGSGVREVTRTDSGRYRVEWSEPFADDRYGISVTLSDPAATGVAMVRSVATDHVEIATYRFAGGQPETHDFAGISVRVSNG